MKGSKRKEQSCSSRQTKYTPGRRAAYAAIHKSWVGPWGIVLPRKPLERGVAAKRRRTTGRNGFVFVGGKPNYIGWMTNPFHGTGSLEHCEQMYRMWLLYGIVPEWCNVSREIMTSMRALTLYTLPKYAWKKWFCSCPIGAPCHTNVWKELLFGTDCPF